jgi:hypothetical protein
MIKNILFLFFSLFYMVVQSQTFLLSGKISDEKEGLAFASVLVKGTSTGVNSNGDGFYTLRLPAGKYEIVYQYVGYAKKTVSVELNSDKVQNVTLVTEGVSLKEIEVNAGEDPAYAVIRQAIKKRKFYQNQVKAYTCKAYIKGLQRLKSVPKTMQKMMSVGGEKFDSTMLGVVYLSESESKYHFRKPDDEKEIMYSSKVSGNNQAFSFNQLSDMNFNFYDNLIEIDGLSDRPFTSPIHENAFLYYKYRMLGVVYEDGKAINKIQVIPRVKNGPCFRGTIYIQENTWRITSADLLLTKDAKIDFVDTLYIKQLQAPVAGDSVWMPVSINFSFDFKFLGIKGNGYFNAAMKEFDIKPVFPKKFFKNEVLKVEDEANKKDSSYWQENRPIPLTQEEVNDYRKKDSIAKLKNTDRYKDSLDKKHNKFGFSNLVLGYSYRNSKKKWDISVPGLINSGVQYNTVEGLNASYNISFFKSFEDYRNYSITAKARYGVSNYLWGGVIGATYFFKPEKFSRVSLNLQSIVQQYNGSEPILPLFNTSYTLFRNENFMKLYKETSAEVKYNSELVNGLILNSSLKYAERVSLENSTDELIIDDKKKLFTSNDPRYAHTHDSLEGVSNAFTADVNFSIRFKQKYYTLPHQKIITGSKYPIINIGYRKAIAGLNTQADYDLVRASVSDDLKLGLFGMLSYYGGGGYFLNAKKMYFMDYKHFDGNQTIMTTRYNRSFFLLPYYAYSSNDWWVQAQAEHHFNGFIFNKIPLLKKLPAKEVVGVRYLSNEKITSYYEINFGLEEIFKILRVDYILSYGVENKVRQGFTFGLNLDF